MTAQIHRQSRTEARGDVYFDRASGVDARLLRRYRISAISELLL
jgi:hypothetical protein